MVNINVSDLEQPEVVDALRSFSFEYLLAGVASKYAEINGINYQDLGYFNEHNELTRSAAFVYPFFISLANGHSNALYKLFGDFETLIYGPASSAIIKMAYNSNEFKFKYFQLRSEKNPIGIEVLHHTHYKNFEDIQNSLKKEPIHIPTFAATTFEDICIESNNSTDEAREYTALYKAINSGIKIIHDQSKKYFFAANSKTILFQASYFSAFQNAFVQNERKVIYYNEIEPPQQRPFFLKEEPQLTTV
jgi:hypothetical protein